MKKRKRLIFFIVFVGILASVIGYCYKTLNSVNRVEISKDDQKLGIKDKKDEESMKETNSNKDEIINIALFGGDRRSKNEATHSDAIMIVTLDKLNKKIKVSSIMRDTYVDVPGHGMTKITHAYGYGGPELAIRTLNENFDLNIRDYAFVDFFSFEELVDILGGVDVHVKENEVAEINKFIRETARIKNRKPHLISSSGDVHLNGAQTVSYSRIRKVGNGDFERTERQRRVLIQLFEKIKNAGLTKYPKIVDALLPCVETSVSKMDMIKLGTFVLNAEIDEIEQDRFP